MNENNIFDIGIDRKLNCNDMNKILNAYLFKEYIMSLGFNPERYDQILELNQGVIGSLSILLKNYRQFLLSTKVKYSELHEFGIYGANGYVSQDGIFVPKSLEADEHFFGGYLPKVPYIRHWYEYPKMDDDFCEYDVTVSNGFSQEDRFDLVMKSDMDLFLGDVLDMSLEDYKANRSQLLTKLSKMVDDSSDLRLSIDSDCKLQKEYVLLSRRNK